LATRQNHPQAHAVLGFFLWQKNQSLHAVKRNRSFLHEKQTAVFAVVACVGICVTLTSVVSVFVSLQTKDRFLVLKKALGNFMDTVSDMIIRMKNAMLAGRDTVSFPYSNLKHALARKLAKRGYFSEVLEHGAGAQKILECVFAKTEKGNARFRDVRRVSKLGKRVYTSARDVRPVRGGLGNVLVSTPKGVLFGDEARKEGVGGEVLFEIW
jgi:small subunit ribosomal protein S8